MQKFNPVHFVTCKHPGEPKSGTHSDNYPLDVTINFSNQVCFDLIKNRQEIYANV